MPTVPSPPWDDIYKEVKVAMPGLTDAVFQQASYQVWKDFTDKTNLWTEEVPINVTPNVLSYQFTCVNGQPNRLLLLYDPAQQDPDRKWVQGNVGMQVPGIITISYSPSMATVWNAVVAKIPVVRSSQNYPDIDTPSNWIVDKYRDGLVFGIMGRLQNLPAKTYSNPKLAMWNRQNYIAERSKARADGQKANVYGGQRWQYPQSFATTGRKGWT